MFPLNSEIDSFFMLCNAILDNYYCLDPLDKSVRAFKEKEITCRAAMALIRDRIHLQKVSNEFNFMT